MSREADLLWEAFDDLQASELPSSYWRTREQITGKPDAGFQRRFDALLGAVFAELDDDVRDRVLARAKVLEAESGDDDGE